MASWVVLGKWTSPPLSFLTSNPLPSPSLSHPHSKHCHLQDLLYKEIVNISLTNHSFLYFLLFMPLLPLLLRPFNPIKTSDTLDLPFPLLFDLIIDPIRVHGYCLCPSLVNTFSTLSSATSAWKAPALLLFSSSTSVFMPNCLEKFTHIWGLHKFMGSHFSQTLSTQESCINN